MKLGTVNMVRDMQDVLKVPVQKVHKFCNKNNSFLTNCDFCLGMFLTVSCTVSSGGIFRLSAHWSSCLLCVLQEGLQAMTTSRSKCPPAVPKRGPDTRLSSASSSSESSVFSLQVITLTTRHRALVQACTR